MPLDALAETLTNSPWPSNQSSVVFLLDAFTSLEEDLLKRWIEKHRPSSAGAAIVSIPLGDDRKPIAVQRLLSEIQHDDSALVVPLRVCWVPSDKAYAAGPRLVDLLGGGERRPNSLRAKRIMLTSPERVQPVVGLPATVSDMRNRYRNKYGLESADNALDFGVFVARQAAIVLDMAERKLQGGRYKTPRYVAQSLRNNPQFRAQLKSIADKKNLPIAEINQEVNEYFKEMISIPTSFWIDVWAKFCNFCLGLGYEPELRYRTEDLERIRSVVRNHPSALLWTHKTYIDGFVVPKILFDNNFPVPHFFGGANLNIPLLGFLVRRAGGIFIKRSFKDNDVYKATLRHYISYLMEKRFPLTWSFEGTRSRLGKLMPPKYGVLKYVLEGCYSAGARDVHIIPVSVTYDLVRDAEEYAREQAGVPKAPESLSWLFGYVRSLARPMGKIYVDFGEPVVLSEVPNPDDKLALAKIAFQVAVESNRVTPVTIPAVVSMALLGVYPRALTEEEATVEVTDLVNLARSRGLRLSPDFNEQFAAGIGKLLDLMIGEDILTRFDGGPSTVFGIKAGRAAVASYYRNTIVHYFVNQAIAELCLIAVAENPNEEPSELFWREVDELRDLFKFEFFYPPSDVFREEVRTELQRVSGDWELELARGGPGARKLLLLMKPQLAHMTLQMFAEAYSLGADILANWERGSSITEEEFSERCMNYGRQALLQARITSEASMGKLLFKNCWSMLSARRLTDESRPDFLDARSQQANQLRRLVRRIEISRASAIASRGTQTLRESVSGQL